MIQSTEITGSTNLKSIVANVITDTNDYTLKGYNRYLNYSIRGMKELSIFNGKDFYKEVELTINDVGCITLPSDFLDYMAVGVKYRGKLWTFTKKDGLVSPNGESCGVEAYDDDEEYAISGNRWVCGYGVEGGSNSFYFKIERKNNRIVLNGVESYTKVRLRYKSSGVSLDGATIVPKIYEEFLIAYIHWRAMQFDKGHTVADKELAKRNFNDEYEKLTNALSPKIDEWYDAIYSGYTQSLKR